MTSESSSNETKTKTRFPVPRFYCLDNSDPGFHDSRQRRIDRPIHRFRYRFWRFPALYCNGGVVMYRRIHDDSRYFCPGCPGGAQKIKQGTPAEDLLVTFDHKRREQYWHKDCYYHSFILPDGLNCPRCGKKFTDEDVNKYPEKFHTCRQCGCVSHRRCRGDIREED